MFLNFAILENESNTDNKMKHGRLGRIFVTFCRKSKENRFEIKVKIPRHPQIQNSVGMTKYKNLGNIAILLLFSIMQPMF